MTQDEPLQYRNTQIGYVSGGSGLAGLLITYAGLRTPASAAIAANWIHPVLPYSADSALDSGPVSFR